MSEFRCGVVITSAPGRLENLELMLDYLASPLAERPELVVVCLDGHNEVPRKPNTDTPIIISQLVKHEPGKEQPRNVGARILMAAKPELTHVWFLDCDILVDADALRAYRRAVDESGDNVILIGPYEWLPGGTRLPMPELRNDQRWAMFEERGKEVTVAELGVALGNFGGNLVWPVEAFRRVGGFHPQLHHGRCEDGELGLRAASLNVPMRLVADARGWHLAHTVNHELAVQRNARDVPLLNSWHPWVQVKCASCGTVWEGGRNDCANCGGTETKGGLIVTEQDGARFDYLCQCGAQVNTLEMWDHVASHSRGWENGVKLILPDGLQ